MRQGAGAPRFGSSKLSRFISEIALKMRVQLGSQNIPSEKIRQSPLMLRAWGTRGKVLMDWQLFRLSVPLFVSRFKAPEAR
jgi:hypothetical protein